MNLLRTAWFYFPLHELTLRDRLLFYSWTESNIKLCLISVDPFLLGLWEGETSRPGADTNLEFKALQSLVGWNGKEVLKAM